MDSKQQHIEVLILHHENGIENYLHDLSTAVNNRSKLTEQFLSNIDYSKVKEIESNINKYFEAMNIATQCINNIDKIIELP